MLPLQKDHWQKRKQELLLPWPAKQRYKHSIIGLGFLKQLSKTLIILQITKTEFYNNVLLYKLCFVENYNNIMHHNTAHTFTFLLQEEILHCTQNLQNSILVSYLLADN